ncbi:SDR family oxidoreductase [Xanthocytophaga agilis]|uniref:SDR family NAD(P)-dependent oxidoreductase n=1 Tax=Xanthocytophaga agilis TaxID=3048010 RepID=A0AAE3QXB6_9BACT|nr:SDR family NAD(P)-dependent oxidoreductase [Xanthocytophaga agilis]MDJ1499746.1 SDR family NAD(P)-dependent oxidoreductase [Xanthocytophaga agilis]
MKTSNNTILITGGSAGIGFEIAKQFVSKSNKVIITGRDENRLKYAAEQLPGVIPIVSDISKEEDVEKLVSELQTEYPQLNMVINNAGKAYLHDLSENTQTFDYASAEILTNYLSIIRLNEKLLPILKKQPESAIVQVSSVVAFVPNHKLSTYSASKAALHSYSQSIRISLENTSVKVFELMPPLVNTDFSKEIGGENGISPQVVAADLIHALENNIYEIHVGQTAYIYDLSKSSPEDALLAMNRR